MGVSAVSPGSLFQLPSLKARGGKDDARSGEGQPAEAKSVENEARVRELRQTDQAIRQHEQAHQSAGGTLAGAASYSYVKGPDGRSYAVAGEVPIEMSPASTPEATISKMEQVKRAALAPSDPSPQDRRVAAQAEAQKQQAQQELAAQQRAALEGKGEGGGEGGAPPAVAARAASAYGAAAGLGAAAAPRSTLVA